MFFNYLFVLFFVGDSLCREVRTRILSYQAIEFEADQEPCECFLTITGQNYNMCFLLYSTTITITFSLFICS